MGAVRWSRLAGFLLLIQSIAGCGLAPLPGAPDPPLACDRVFSADRCEAIATAAAVQLGVRPQAIATIWILPEPTPELAEDGGRIVLTRSGGPRLRLGVSLADGTTQRAEMCGGISAAFVPACMDDPRLQPTSVTLGGYGDIPCQDADGLVCATPLPPIDPAVAADVKPLFLERVDIPIEDLGRQEIPLGRGTLPNGVLSEASFRLVDDWPDALRLADGWIHLDVRSLAPDGKPFDNRYRHGWLDGVEPFEAVLVLDVVDVEGGAVLSIEDVVVR
jgi:hypothetical protein